MKTLAPICLFVYNRPWHTIQTVEALKKNKLASDSELFIFSDGPKNELIAESVSEVRSYIKAISGFKKVSINFHENNLGLANNIIYGVSKVVNEYGKVIVLEDDLVCSSFFLQYMNDGLDLYENENSVASIHGYVYPIKNLPETFFIKGADCWGWSTWRRAWNLFEIDGEKLLNQIKTKGLVKEFDFNGQYPYTKMLERQVEGKNNSWAIRWYASAFLNNMYTLYPGTSLIKNIGFDGSGTHSDKQNNYNSDILEQEINLKKIIGIINDNDERIKFSKYFRSIRFSRITNRLKRIFASFKLF